MKNFIIFVLFSIGLNLFGQNDSIENSELFKLKHVLNEGDFLETYKDWLEIIKTVGQYPNLPIDIDKKVHFSFVNNFKGENKEQLFHRTLEWIYLRYGIIPNNIYSDKESGKIILNNNINIDTDYYCNYTAIMTMKDEKLMFEFINIAYQPSSDFNSNNNNWVNIENLVPIVQKSRQFWKPDLVFLKKVTDRFNSEMESLVNYINDYSLNYNF